MHERSSIAKIVYIVESQSFGSLKDEHSATFLCTHLCFNPELRKPRVRNRTGIRFIRGSAFESGSSIIAKLIVRAQAVGLDARSNICDAASEFASLIHPFGVALKSFGMTWGRFEKGRVEVSAAGWLRRQDGVRARALARSLAREDVNCYMVCWGWWRSGIACSRVPS